MKRICITLCCILLATCQLFSQTINFESKKKQAESYARQGQYSKAISTMRRALDSFTTLSDAERKEGESKIRNWRSQQNHLQLSADTLYLSAIECADTVMVEAGQPGLLAISPDKSASWFTAELDAEQGFVRVHAPKNPRREERLGTLYVTMGKRIKTPLVVIQDPRPDVKRLVKAVVTPAYANVSVDGEKRKVNNIFEVSGGEKYVFHFEKESYYPKDTTIFIPDKESKDTILVTTKLTPRFAMIRVKLEFPDTCNVDTTSIRLRINNSEVDNFVSGRKESYDSDDDLHRFLLYDDGTIPVRSERDLNLVITADNFKDSKRAEAELKDGEEREYVFKMEPRTGQLALYGNSYAYGADVMVDGRKIGVIDRDTTTYTVQTGRHIITAASEGVRTKAEAYEVYVSENKETSQYVPMVPDIRIVFVSQPAGATITLDGKQIDSKTPTPSLPTDNMRHVAVATLDGYVPVIHNFRLPFGFGYTHTHTFEMKPADTLRITADKKDLFVDILGAKDEADSVFAKDVLLPADVSLYRRKVPYDLRFYKHNPDGSRTEVFKDKLSFKPGGKDRYLYKTWPADHFSFQVLSADMLLVPKDAYFPITSTSSGEALSFRSVGTASLFRLGWNQIGLSTAIVKARQFLESETGNPSYKSLGWGLQAFSIVGLNWEWRGGFSFWKKRLQFNILGSYAWYPNFQKNVIPFSTISGHDIFIGGELATASRVATLYVKAGWQMYKGMEANFFPKGSNSDCTVQAFVIPEAFTVSVGISFPQWGKGNPAVRFWTW